MAIGLPLRKYLEDVDERQYNGGMRYQIICCTITRKVCKHPNHDCSKCSIARKNGLPVINHG